MEEPATRLVTVTFAVVALAANTTVDGTVATLVVPELKLMVNPPAGAWPPIRVRTSVPELLLPTLRVDGENVIVGATTVAVLLPDIVIELPFHVEIEPVINEVPTPLPVTVAVLEVLPALIVMLDGVGTFVVLPDVKLTVTPPVGATCDNVTVKLVDKPKPTDGLVNDMPMTVTTDVVLVMPA